MVEAYYSSKCSAIREVDGEVRLDEKQLLQPLRWRRPRKIFWNAHGDLFHDAVPDEWIDRVFAVCALTPQHTHMILTKRSARMREYFQDPYTGMHSLDVRISDLMEQIDPIDDKDVSQPYHWPLPNVWLGVSVEDQQRADERIPDLLATPAAKRFISAEPLLGPVDLAGYLSAPWEQLVSTHLAGDGIRRSDITGNACPGLDWVIVGGESGPGARPMHPNWVRSLRDQCAAAGTAFFFKQWGEFAPGEIAGEHLNPNRAAKGMEWFDGRWQECWSEVDGHCDDEPDVYRIGKKRAGNLLDGVQHLAFPTTATGGQP